MNFINNGCGCSQSQNNAAGQNLVYLDKVYFDQTQNSCPIIDTLATTPAAFTQRLSVTSPAACISKTRCYTGSGCDVDCPPSINQNMCGCCNDACSDFVLTEGTIFNITRAWVNVSTFTLSADAAFTAADVTVDGNPVTALTQTGGRWTADLSGIINELITCRNDGHFFLAQVPGPWVLNGSIFVEGTVSTGGNSCCFNACFETLPEADGGFTFAGADNFALYNIEIPCRSGGVSPTISFGFDGCASLLNPDITVTGTAPDLTLTLTGTLVVTPQINLQVIKPALFSINASEILLPCDNNQRCSCESDIICSTCISPCENDCNQPYEPFYPEKPSIQEESHPCIQCQCCDTNGYSF